jgi:hypothetical protein
MFRLRTQDIDQLSQQPINVKNIRETFGIEDEVKAKPKPKTKKQQPIMQPSVEPAKPVPVTEDELAIDPGHPKFGDLLSEWA